MSREQTVRDVAYAIWEAEGKPDGRDVDHWQQAEARVAASLVGGEAQAEAKPPAKVSSNKPAAKPPAKAAATAAAPVKASTAKIAPKKKP